MCRDRLSVSQSTKLCILLATRLLCISHKLCIELLATLYQRMVLVSRQCKLLLDRAVLVAVPVWTYGLAVVENRVEVVVTNHNIVAHSLFANLADGG